MSVEYDLYLIEHGSNVNQAYYWLRDHFPDIRELRGCDEPFYHHDDSKYSPEEYDAYDAFFYGNNKSSQVVTKFNEAWLHHIHDNPHHWQYWVLVQDDSPEILLEMPDRYIVEMICDWWSFSFKTGNLYELFDWYDRHENIKLHPETRKKVDRLLQRIRAELDKTRED